MKKILILALAIAMIPSLVACRQSSEWKTVTSSSTIEWCEDSSPAKYLEIKELFSELVGEQTGNVPEKVCFSINIGNYVWGTYEITLYYLIDGTWYVNSFSHDDIGHANADLDKALLQEFCGW